MGKEYLDDWKSPKKNSQSISLHLSMMVSISDTQAKEILALLGDQLAISMYRSGSNQALPILAREKTSISMHRSLYLISYWVMRLRFHILHERKPSKYQKVHKYLTRWKYEVCDLGRNEFLTDMEISMSYQSSIFPKNYQKKKKSYDQNLRNSVNNNIQISCYFGYDPESLSRSLRDFFNEEKTCRDDRKVI